MVTSSFLFLATFCSHGKFPQQRLHSVYRTPVSVTPHCLRSTSIQINVLLGNKPPGFITSSRMSISWTMWFYTRLSSQPEFPIVPEQRRLKDTVPLGFPPASYRERSLWTFWSLHLLLSFAVPSKPSTQLLYKLPATEKAKQVTGSAALQTTPWKTVWATWKFCWVHSIGRLLAQFKCFHFGYRSVAPKKQHKKQMWTKLEVFLWDNASMANERQHCNNTISLLPREQTALSSGLFYFTRGDSKSPVHFTYMSCLSQPSSSMTAFLPACKVVLKMLLILYYLKVMINSILDASARFHF